MDAFADGKRVRKLKRVKLAPVSMGEREVKKIADEIVRPLNQGIITVGSAVNFAEYVKDTYLPTDLPLLAKTVQNSYQGIIDKHLNPAFENATLGEMDAATVQRFFSAMPARGIPYPTISKVRDALSSVMRSAVRYGYITRNPLDNLRLPPDKRGKRQKPFIYPAQFEAILELIPEPYATMVYVAVWTGLRVSELSALKWRCIHADSITVEQRYCRGDWSETKTPGSAATISVDGAVISRIHRLKTLTVDVRAGLAVRHYKVVKKDGPDDLVFQSVKAGKPMNDGNILRRFIKPAAELLKLEHVNWRCLRTSCATWMVRAGADPKSVQGQMRHSRIATTLEIYAQFVPEGQRRAVEQMTEYARKSILEAGTEPVTVSVQ
ncbi:MAG TPA: tyrosine-type recombinase/integrase [Candidatus Sulfotelmatobacter sp.]|nr:tyrosine-type recombinase/integrase [Candidatus Sulfotelmatobacter sp.]